MRIISLCSFWAVNHVASFCHVVAQMIIMNEIILSYGATHYCSFTKLHVMDGSALKHFKYPDNKNALEGIIRCHMHAFIFLTCI